MAVVIIVVMVEVEVEVKVEVVIGIGVGVVVGVGVTLQSRTVFLLAKGSTHTEPRRLDGNGSKGALTERVLFADLKFGSAGRG